MKHFHWYALGLTVLIAISLFLPYETHDYQNGSFFSPGTITKRDIHLAGLSIWGAYVPIVLFILLSFFIIQWKNLAVAIIGLVGSALLLVYNVVMGFLLTFSLNFGGGPVNKHVNVGFFILFFATVGFIALMIVNLIVTIRIRKKLSQHQTPNPDLLDELLD